MNVNTKSWHYRFNVWRTNTWKTRRKNTLCSYFWFTVINMAFISSAVAVCVGLVYMLGYGFHEELLKYGYDFLSFPYYTGHLIVLLLGCLLILCVVLVALVFLTVGWNVKLLFDKSIDLLNKRSNKEKEPGLVMSYIKAKKSKICPIIEFKD